MFFADGGTIPHRPLHRAARRGRLAFVLGKRLTGPDCTIFDVYDAVDYVVPALEIIDARSQSIDPDTKRPRRCSTRSPTTRRTRAS